MAKGEIIAIRDVAAGLGRPMDITHKEVTYRIDGLGPYSFLMPIEEFTPAKVQEEVKKRVSEWGQVVGKIIVG